MRYKSIQGAGRSRRKTESAQSLYNRDDSGEKKAAATITDDVMLEMVIRVSRTDQRGRAIYHQLSLAQ
jgi:hypothetical protein